MSEDVIKKADLEYALRVFFDTKKVLAYNKHEDPSWSWKDRDGECFDGYFPTALDAILDAVDPYLNHEE